MESQPPAVVSNELEDHLNEGLQEHFLGEVLFDGLFAVKDCRQDDRKVIYGEFTDYLEGLTVFNGL